MPPQDLVPRRCHYCPGPGNTRDHIVPRCLVRELARRISMEDFYGLNIVHACEDCNQEKGNGRGSCQCSRCVKAWEHYERKLRWAAGVEVPSWAGLLPDSLLPDQFRIPA